MANPNAQRQAAPKPEDDPEYQQDKANAIKKLAGNVAISGAVKVLPKAALALGIGKATTEGIPALESAAPHEVVPTFDVLTELLKYKIGPDNFSLSAGEIVGWAFAAWAAYSTWEYTKRLRSIQNSKAPAGQVDEDVQITATYTQQEFDAAKKTVVWRAAKQMGLLGAATGGGLAAADWVQGAVANPLPGTTPLQDILNTPAFDGFTVADLANCGLTVAALTTLFFGVLSLARWTMLSRDVYDGREDLAIVEQIKRNRAKGPTPQPA